VCASGVCTAGSSCVPRTEICGNGVDDDCDGVIDDGCSAPACRTDADCAAGQRCTAGVCTAA
jgi:Cys-rich repeat protein